jgi:N-methylhydantoinase A
MNGEVLQVAADIGGTFTDIVFQFADGRLEKRKVETTPDDFGRAIVEGVTAWLAGKGLTGGGVHEVLHATTVATNAILERRGAKTALVTTEGFRDVLELRRIRIPFSYDLSWSKPEPMAEREFRFEVKERIAADGAILVPFDAASLEPALEAIRERGIESVAVSLLHAYQEAKHEMEIATLLRSAFPDLPLSLSHEILPEAREFERTSTTVVNAYVAPLVSRYLERLRARFLEAGIRAPILVMQSAGGLISAGAAARNAVTIIESGPAAGVVAAARIARANGHSNIITFDMGGTTTKASILEKDEMLRASEYEVGSEISVSSRLVRGSGYLLKIPVIDISEVGAGGGSLARMDAAGALRVGPQSASSVPGPACYGKGNDRPTVTDANLVLGYLSAGSLAGGSLAIDPEFAKRAVDRHVAGPAGMDTPSAAWGIHLIAISNMVRAIKTVSVERGRDPADFALMAFGGAGPLHAAQLARELGIRQVLIPPSPGVFSAFGLLAAPIEQHGARSVLCSTSPDNADRIGSAYRRLRDDVTARLVAEGLDPEKVSFSTSADLRYRGQSAELTVPFDDRSIHASSLGALEEAFEAEFERTFGHRSGSKAFDFVTARVVATVARSNPPSSAWAEIEAPAGRTPARPAYFGPEHGFVDTPVIGRHELGDEAQPGPLLIQEYDTTVVVPPDFSASLDRGGNIVIAVPRR